MITPPRESAPGAAIGTERSSRATTLLAGAALVALAMGGVIFFLARQRALAGNLWGEPLDDAYIHFRFAQNLATGHGFAFNPGQPVPGSTSPLWVVLLALAARLGAPLPTAAKVYGSLFLAVSALLAWLLAARVFAAALPGPGVGVAAWATGALVALDGRLLWAAPSGMEVTLFTALGLAAFLARPPADAEQRPAARRVLSMAALCGLATLARPEGYLLALVLGADVLWRHRPPPAMAAAAIALFLALTAPYNIFALLTTGHPLATTFYAKHAPLGPPTVGTLGRDYHQLLDYLRQIWAYAALTNPLLPWAALPGAAVLALRARRGPRGAGIAAAMVAWPALLLVEQGILSPLVYHFGRYTMPLEPFFAIAAVAATLSLARGLRAALRGWAPDDAAPGTARSVGLPSLALVVVGASALGVWATLYARSVREIDSMQVDIGRWVRGHVPAGTPIALNDIGAITYVAGRPAVDVVGLVTPRFIAIGRESPDARRADDLYAEVRRRGARYLIIFPAWYPLLAARAPRLGLHPVYSRTIPHPIIVGAPTMVVYRIVDNIDRPRAVRHAACDTACGTHRAP